MTIKKHQSVIDIFVINVKEKNHLYKILQGYVDIAKEHAIVTDAKVWIC